VENTVPPIHRESHQTDISDNTLVQMHLYKQMNLYKMFEVLWLNSRWNWDKSDFSCTLFEHMENLLTIIFGKDSLYTEYLEDS
jgi:hypothetical protein